MVICIIAGGEGTRLWPLSQPHRPKHLLPLVDDKSLLQNTYCRAQQLSDQIFVISEASHAEQVAEQLPDLPTDHLIIEPARRGTASCIILALARLSKVVSLDESIVFLHADHHIVQSQQFFAAVREAIVVATKLKTIALIGLRPTYPATGFGYIEQGLAVSGDAFEVKSFHEKPDLVLATNYLKRGNYLWNLGLFAGTFAVFINMMEKFAPELARVYQELAEAKDRDSEHSIYLKAENQPIDTALIEKINGAVVVVGKFDWADLGSFGDLYEVLSSEGQNVYKGALVEMLDCDNSMVLGHSDRPIVAIGLQNIVIVDSPDGLLVVEATQAQRVKEALANLRQRRDT